MELSGVDVQAASAACHSLEWSRSTPTAMNLVTASSADSSKSPFAGAKPRRSLESISQEDQAASPARRSKRATTGIDYAVVATGRVPAKKSKPSAAPGSRAAPEAASVDSPAPSSARQRQDDLAQPATQKKARYLRYCDAVYTLFSEAAASKQLAPWESLTGDYREELFSKVLECQVSQPARGGSVDKAEAMRNLRDSHEHLEWAASQWAAALQKALDKQGQGQGQGQAAPHVQHGAAGRAEAERWPVRQFLEFRSVGASSLKDCGKPDVHVPEAPADDFRGAARHCSCCDPRRESPERKAAAC